MPHQRGKQGRAEFWGVFIFKFLMSLKADLPLWLGPHEDLCCLRLHQGHLCVLVHRPASVTYLHSGEAHEENAAPVSGKQNRHTHIIFFVTHQRVHVVSWWSWKSLPVHPGRLRLPPVPAGVQPEVSARQVRQHPHGPPQGQLWARRRRRRLPSQTQSHLSHHLL